MCVLFDFTHRCDAIVYIVCCCFPYWKYFSLATDLSEICMKNLRQTIKYAGRKNVPLLEEVNAIMVSKWKHSYSVNDIFFVLIFTFCLFFWYPVSPS